MRLFTSVYKCIGGVFAFVLTLLLLTTCSEVLLEPDIKPDQVYVGADRFEVLLHDQIEAELNLVDVQGNIIQNVPAWLDTVITSGGGIIKIKNGKFVAVNSGKAEVEVKVGAYHDSFTLLVIPRLLMTQSVQNKSRSVTMVAGRDGVVRLFIKDNEKKLIQEGVTVELYQNGSKVQEIHYEAQELTFFPVRGQVSSLELFVPGRYIQPGLAVRVKLSSETYFPAEPHSVVVQTVPEFHLRLVPIYVSVTGKTGDVNVQNKDEYMEALLDMFPINEYQVDVHEPVTISANPADQGNFYNKTLSQLAGIHYIESSNSKVDSYYYGVIPQSTGGTIGLGYVGTLDVISDRNRMDYRTAVGWDRPGYKNRSATMAHELGHTFSLLHAPCGGVKNSDLNYPYAEGYIGAYGYEVDRGELKNPTDYHDLMGYCDPVWISDYNYMKVMNYRNELHETRSDVSQPQDVLLLWGWVNGRKMTLKPALRVEAVPRFPNKNGPYTVSGFDVNKNKLFSFSFSGIQISHRSIRHFLFGIPVDRVDMDNLHSLELSYNHKTASQKSREGNAVQGTPTIAAQRTTSKSVSIQLQSSHYKMMMIKNSQTGEILGFTKKGLSTFKTNANQLKLYLSDGVHTTTKTVSVQ